MKYYYLLPKRNFFKRGYRGSSLHALGIIDGFNKNKVELNVLHFGGLLCFLPNQSNTHFKSFVSCLKQLRSILQSKDTRLLIRYSISNVFFIYVLTFFRSNESNICLEVNSVHGMQGSNGLLTSIIVFFEKILLKRIGNIYVVSKNAKSYLENEYNIDSNSIFVLPNAVIYKDFFEVDSSRSAENIRIVYLGSVKEYYDLTSVCKWLVEYNLLKGLNIELHIFGNDDVNLFNTLNDVQQQYCVIHGPYKNSDVYDIVRDKDILILPLRNVLQAKYISPLKIYEYMALKLPILTTSIGQLSDIIKHGHNGLIYNDRASFFEALDLLVNDKTLREKLGGNALLDVNHNHTWEKRVQNLIQSWK